MMKITGMLKVFGWIIWEPQMSVKIFVLIYQADAEILHSENLDLLVAIEEKSGYQ